QASREAFLWDFLLTPPTYPRNIYTVCMAKRAYPRDSCHRKRDGGNRKAKDRSGDATKDVPRGEGGVMRVKWIGTGLAVVVLAGVAAALGFAWPFGKRAPELKLPGVVEIHEVRLGPRVAGRVKEVLVTESVVVEAGQVLLRLDVPDLE